MSGWFKFGFWLFLTLGYAHLSGGQIPYFIFYVSLVLFTAAALTRLWFFCLTVETHLAPGVTQVGGKVNLEVAITNRTFLPLPWLSCSIYPLEKFGKKILHTAVTCLKGKTTETLSFSFSCDRRGFFNTGIAEISVGDIFGLLSFKKRIEIPFELIIYPRLIDVQRLLLSSDNVLGRQTFLRLGQQTTMMAGIRKYVPGDQLTRIHWKASAKKQELLVKEFEKQIIDQIHIFVDGTLANHVGEGDNSTAEWTIIVAASLAQETLQKGYKVALCMSGAEKLEIPPGKGRAHLLHILEILAKAQVSDNFPFEEIVTRELVGRYTGTLFLVTAHIDKELVEVVHVLQMHGQNPFLIFLNPTTFDPAITAGKASEMVSRLNNYRIPVVVVEKALLERSAWEGDYASNLPKS